MSGGVESTVLTYTDSSGRQVQITTEGGVATSRYTDTGQPALPLVGTVASDVETLRSLVVVQAGDLGLVPMINLADETPELAEARTTLAELTKELRNAMSARQRHDQLELELTAVERQLRIAEDGAARRAYAQVLAELEKVRAEAAALKSGTVGADADQHLLASADDARDLAAHWRAADAEAEQQRTPFGDTERLDAPTVAQARWYPEQPPADLA